MDVRSNHVSVEIIYINSLGHQELVCYMCVCVLLKKVLSLCTWWNYTRRARTPLAGWPHLNGLYADLRFHIIWYIPLFVALYNIY